MVSSRQVARGAQRLTLAVLIALPSVAAAQAHGDGFLFRKPKGSFAMRAGYEVANTSSQPFTVLQEQTTIGPRSFDAFNLGLDANFFLTKRVDLSLTLDVSSRTTTAEYRDWEEDGRPITHESTLDRVALGGGFRVNLLDRGRQISALAFIPARTLPYVGANAGVLWYEFMQEGDFVEEDPSDPASGSIFYDELKSDHYNLMTQVYGGVERRLNARWSLVGEARYTKSEAKLVKDYAGLGEIQLSGLAFTLGATVRF